MCDDHGAVSGLRCPHLRQVLLLCSFSAGLNCSFHVTVKQKSSAKHSCGSQQLDKGFFKLFCSELSETGQTCRHASPCCCAQTLNCCSSFKLRSIALMLSAAWRTSTKALITISLQGKRAHHFNVKPGKLFCGKRHSHHFLFCVNVEVWNTPYDDDDTHETRRSYMTDSWSCERFPPAKRPRCPISSSPCSCWEGHCSSSSTSTSIWRWVIHVISSS